MNLKGILSAISIALSTLTASATIIATVQPDATLGSDSAYIITFSWENETDVSGSGWTSGANGYLDDKTTLANGNYVIPSGANAGLQVGYHNHAFTNVTGGHVDWDGTDPNTIASGTEGADTFFRQFGLGTGTAFLDNTVNAGALLLYGSGVQGVTSLTSHNGIDGSSIHGSKLGEPYGVRINDNPGSADFLGVLVQGAPQFEGLAIISLPNANDGGFLDLFVPGVYTDEVNDIMLTVTTDPAYVPQLVPEPAALTLLLLGGLFLSRRVRR